jgi:hypothetical protein
MPEISQHLQSTKMSKTNGQQMTQPNQNEPNPNPNLELVQNELLRDCQTPEN